MAMLTCNGVEFPFTKFPFLSFSTVTVEAAFFNVGDDICRLCLLGGTITELLGSNTLAASSTLDNIGGLSVTLLRLGRPGQFVSINGSDIGIVGELTTFSVGGLPEVHVEGGSGGVKFLDTDLIISGDERTLVGVTFDGVVTTFVTNVLVIADVSEEATKL